MHGGVIEVLDAFGVPRESIATAVVIGHEASGIVASVRAQLPALRDLLVIDPARCRSDREAHLECIAWLLEHDAAVAATPWFVDARVPDEHGIARTIEDLFWSGSAELFARLDAEGDEWPSAAPWLQPWSDRLLAQSLVLPALRCDLAIHRATPSPALARRIGIAWGRLGAPARALTWLRRSDLPTHALRNVAAELDENAAAMRDDAATMLADNLEHLRLDWPEVAATIEATSSSTADVVWISDVAWRLRMTEGRALVQRDELPLLVDETNGALVVHNAPEHPRALRDQLHATSSRETRHACLGSVCDYAALVNMLANRMVSSVPGWRQSLYAIEENPSLLRRLLEAVDIRGLTRRDQLQTFGVGTNAATDFAAALRATPRVPVPRVRIACPSALHIVLDRVERDRLAVGRAAVARITARDHLAIPERTLAKLRDGAPLRIWAWTSIHTTVLQHVAAGLAAGFRALGHEVELLVEQSPREQIDPAQIAVSLADADPDLAFLIDHVRPEFASLLPQSLPMAAWILDELPTLVDPRVVAKLGAFDLAFAWSRSLADDYVARGYPHCAPLLFAVDDARYDVPALSPAEDVVAYATHLSLPREPDFAPGLYRALEDRMMAMAEVPSGIEPLAPLLAAAVRELGLVVPPDRADALAYDCLILARHVDRVRIADQLLGAGIPVALFGNGWADIPRFAAHARGPVAPGAALREMYQRHKVVLHINTRCNLHPRVLEASAAGGFVLARSDGEFDLGEHGVSQHLEVDRELCVFTDPSDMIAKIRRAFADEPWRRGFVQAARARVLRDHTFVARARTIVAALEARLAAVLGSPTAGAA